jgi:7-keto-8-aminopelargonate synthetase-like enzyme
VLSRIDADRSVMVVVDGVFSMSGDIADLPGISQAVRRHGARLVVDDAHGVGVIGAGGRGTASHFGLDQEADLIVGTFSKSLASIGGFVAGAARVLDYIQHFGRPMLFGASLLVPRGGGALDVIEQEPERVRRVMEVAHRVRTELVPGIRRRQSVTPSCRFVATSTAPPHLARPAREGSSSTSSAPAVRKVACGRPTWRCTESMIDRAHDPPRRSAAVTG